MNLGLSLLITLTTTLSYAHIPTDAKLRPVLTNLQTLKNLNLPVTYSDPDLGLGMAWLTPKQQEAISKEMHAQGKCAGFEALDDQAVSSARSFSIELEGIRLNNTKNIQYQYFTPSRVPGEAIPSIQAALTEVSPANLKDVVSWLSAFPSRYHNQTDPNVPVNEMKAKIEAMLANAKMPFEVSLIDHSSTRMKSIRVRLPGSTRPNEIVVIGGHFDSIASTGFGGSGKRAPGADDNASGSANVYETLRIVSQKEQPQRTLEFFWYAGEEAGLLGSAEIAKSYKSESKKVVAVLQLDMTLFPGSGPLTIASMTDYTSAWLRDYLVEMNKTYNLGVTIQSDKCGYGCSDHASWYKQGYSTLMPFEAMMNTMNKKIHTPNDLIENGGNFDHSAAFNKIAVVFALDLGNSEKASLF